MRPTRPTKQPKRYKYICLMPEHGDASIVNCVCYDTQTCKVRQISYEAAVPCERNYYTLNDDIEGITKKGKTPIFDDGEPKYDEQIYKLLDRAKLAGLPIYSYQLMPLQMKVYLYIVKTPNEYMLLIPDNVIFMTGLYLTNDTSIPDMDNLKVIGGHNLKISNGLFKYFGPSGCLDLSEFDCSKVISAKNMFADLECKKFISPAVRMENLEVASDMFTHAYIRGDMDLSFIYNVPIRLWEGTFLSATTEGLGIDIQRFDFSKAKTLSKAFKGCINYDDLDFSKTNMPKMYNADNVADMVLNCQCIGGRTTLPLHWSQEIQEAASNSRYRRIE